MASRPDPVDLRAPSSNVMTTLALPADRWPLMAIGGGVGPAFLYWGELLVFLVVASLLGRWPWSPLRTSEWLLARPGASAPSLRGGAPGGARGVARGLGGAAGRGRPGPTPA